LVKPREKRPCRQEGTNANGWSGRKAGRGKRGDEWVLPRSRAGDREASAKKRVRRGELQEFKTRKQVPRQRKGNLEGGKGGGVKHRGKYL